MNRTYVFRFLFFVFFVVLGSNVCKADVIVDGDFESPSSSNNWTSFNQAFPDHSAPGIDSTVEGAQTLRVHGDNDTFVNFAGVFQDVAVGQNLNVGHVVSLHGIVGHTSTDPISGNDTAYLEISFLDSMGIEFGLTPSTAISANTLPGTYVNLSSGPVLIPVGASAVRFKAVFRQDGGERGAAWFDNLRSVEAVPEPTNSVALTALALLALLKRQKR